MKKTLVLFTLVLAFVLPSHAQFDEGAAGTGDHFTIGELAKLGKLELTQIYIDEIQKLNLLLPYIPFNQKGEAVSLANMGIPSTKDNNGAVKDLDESSGGHNEAQKETLSNIIPYADKEDIIKSILFLQDTIERIENGI